MIMIPKEHLCFLALLLNASLLNLDDLKDVPNVILKQTR